MWSIERSVGVWTEHSTPLSFGPPLMGVASGIAECHISPYLLLRSFSVSTWDLFLANPASTKISTSYLLVQKTTFSGSQPHIFFLPVLSSFLTSFRSFVSFISSLSFSSHIVLIVHIVSYLFQYRRRRHCLPKFSKLCEGSKLSLPAAFSSAHNSSSVKL